MGYEKDRDGQKLQEYQMLLRRSPQLYRAAQAMPAEPDALAGACRYVLGPTLGGFVRWLLWRAVADGKKRLYFLARDGYFLYRAALILCEVLGFPLDCRYLCCSRYSLRLPLFHLDHDEALSYICRPGLHVTLSSILQRAGLCAEEQEDVLARLCLPYPKNQALPSAKLGQIRKALSHCQPFLAYMNRHSQEALPGLVGYLKQEGLLEDAAAAIVDSGWVGSMQKTLNQALAQMGRANALEGYYWGLYELPPGVVRSAYHCYFFAPEGYLREKVFFNNCLFEAIFTAPHGMTLSYQKSGERYYPRFSNIPERQRAFTLRISGPLLAYIRLLAKESQKAEFSRQTAENDRHTLRLLLKSFMAAPSIEEAEIFGALPFSDDVLEGGGQPLAAPLTERELRAGHVAAKLLATAQKRDKATKESAWYAGSAALQGKRVRYHWAQHTLWQYLRHLRKSGPFQKKQNHP